MNELLGIPWYPGDCFWRDRALEFGHVFRTDYGFRPACVAATTASWHLLPREPAAHHLLNWGAHLLCAVLVFVLARRSELSTGRALLASVLFVLAPGRIDAAAVLHSACDTMGLAVALSACVLWLGSERIPRLVGLALMTVLACMFKETGFVVAGLLLAWGARERTRRWWTLAVALSASVLLRLVAVGNLHGNYAGALLPEAVGLRGIALGLLGSLTGGNAWLATAGRIGRLSLGEAYPWVRAFLAVAVVGCVFVLARRLPPRRGRTLAVLLLGAGLVACMVTVNERSLYWCGPGAVLLLAQVQLPRRAARPIGFALAALVSVAGIARMQDWRQAHARVLAMRARVEDSAQRAHVDVVPVLAAPDRVDDVWTSIGSECWGRLEADAPRVMLAGRGRAMDWRGPEIRREAGGLTIAATATQDFSYTPCGPVPDGLAPWLEHRCRRGEVVELRVVGRAPPATLVFRNADLQPLSEH